MQKTKTTITLSFVCAYTASILFSLWSPQAVEAATVRSIIFPVIGKSSFTNDFNAPRYINGQYRKHNATDIIAKKGQRLVAAVSGTITDVQYPKPSWGYSVTIRDNAGYKYSYLHMNDDNWGTNDNLGGGMKAYAVDVKEGNRVVKGQLLGWVGDSGYANGIPHLHFEMYGPKGGVINPYYSLLQAKKITSSSPYPALDSEILPYGTFKGGLSIDMGQFDGDAPSEFLSGAGKGGAPRVKVFNDNNNVMKSFYVYETSFNGGVNVAAGDVDGDGVDEIITGTGPGSRPHVKAIKLDGTVLSSFNAYQTTFRGGVNVAAGDVDGDGVDEIITGPARGAGPHVKVFEPSGMLRDSFYSYSTSTTGGVDVAAADITGTANAEIITGAGPGVKTRVGIFSGSGVKILGFIAYGDSFTGGVKVSAGNVRTGSAKAEILTVPANGGSPLVKLYSPNGSLLSTRFFIEQWWRGYHDIAAGEGTSKAGTGVNRRDSIRFGIN